MAAFVFEGFLLYTGSSSPLTILRLGNCMTRWSMSENGQGILFVDTMPLLLHF
jgi:hypothetical protein